MTAAQATASVLRLGVVSQREWPASVQLLVNAIQSSTQLRCDGYALVERSERPAVRLGLGERLFRCLDRTLFGRASNQSVVPAGLAEPASDPAAWLDLSGAASSSLPDKTVPLFRVTFDGQPATNFIEAVRHRLGREGEMVCAVVWLDRPEGAKRLFVAHCCLDHRSLFRSVDWVAAKLPSLIVGAWRRLQLETPDGAASEGVDDPRPHSAARLTARLMQNVWRRLLWRDQWVIQVHRSRSGGDPRPGELVSCLQPPKDSFWADPFIVTGNGGCWAFFEVLPFASERGHISALELDAAGRPLPDAKAQVVLSEPWHLSYPFLWREGDALYMLPESSASRTLNLYVCEGLPSNWRKTATLITDARLADATIVKHQGRYWLFATHGEARACMHDELHLYWANALTGPWHPHLGNPVKIDARSARPAGAMWSHDGRLFRPVQDCSSTYGGAVSVQEVTRLDPGAFSEHEALSLAVTQAPAMGQMHTLNAARDLVVVDRLRKACRLPA